jgi:hypothetical protein
VHSKYSYETCNFIFFSQLCILRMMCVEACQKIILDESSKYDVFFFLFDGVRSLHILLFFLKVLYMSRFHDCLFRSGNYFPLQKFFIRFEMCQRQKTCWPFLFISLLSFSFVLFCFGDKLYIDFIFVSLVADARWKSYVRKIFLWGLCIICFLLVNWVVVSLRVYMW